jgi:hypothetical protein
VSATTNQRLHDVPSPRAEFNGIGYDVVPPRLHARYDDLRHPRTFRLDTRNNGIPTRLVRTCSVRAAGSVAWRPCDAGIFESEDVRFDVLSNDAGVVRHFSLETVSSDVVDEFPGGSSAAISAEVPKTPRKAWTCYRSEFTPSVDTCIEYNMTPGHHRLRWTDVIPTQEETLVVVQNFK